MKHYTVVTAFAAVALGALTSLLAYYNAEGWLNRSLPLLAALAVTTEAIAFIMAVCMELVWARGGKVSVRIIRVLCCFAILTGCEFFNAAGSHEAWRGTMAERAETLVKPQRDAIAKAERLYTEQSAKAQQALDKIAPPDMSGGPLNDAQAIEAWRIQAAPYVEAKAKADKALSEIDRKIDMPEEPFAEEVVWAFLAFLGFVKVVGLWAIGVAFFRPDASALTGQKETPEVEAGNDTETVVILPTGAGRETVRAMRAAGLSYGEIFRRTGVRKGTAYRWCQA